MLLRQSVFQSVVDRLDEEQADEGTQEPASGFAIRGLGSSFVADTGEPPARPDAAMDAYLSNLADDEPFLRVPDDATEAPAEQIPEHLLRLTEEEIARELDIGIGESETALNDKRRRFAKINHPDRVAPQWRDNATTRMKIANLLIDQAISRFAARN